MVTYTKCITQYVVTKSVCIYGRTLVLTMSNVKIVEWYKGSCYVNHCCISCVV